MWSFWNEHTVQSSTQHASDAMLLQNCQTLSQNISFWNIMCPSPSCLSAFPVSKDINTLPKSNWLNITYQVIITFDWSYWAHTFIWWLLINDHAVNISHKLPPSHSGIRIDEVPAPSAATNTTECHQSKVISELWHGSLMSETSLNIHNPGGIRGGLVRQRLQPPRCETVSLAPFPSSPSIHLSAFPATLSTPQCRKSGPCLKNTSHQRHVFFYLTHCSLCRNISLHWKHSQAPWAKLSQSLMLPRWKNCSESVTKFHKQRGQFKFYCDQPGRQWSSR